MGYEFNLFTRKLDKVGSGSSGAITSVFGRSGPAITAQSGDYNTSLVPENTNLYYTNARGIGSVLTGYVSGAGIVAPTDTILQAIQKINGNVAALNILPLANNFTNTNTFSAPVTELRSINLWDGTIYKATLSGSTVFVTLGGAAYTTALIPATVQPSQGGNLTIRCQTGGSVLALRHIGGATSNWMEIGATNGGSITSGTGYNVRIVGGYVASTGNAIYHLFSNEQLINQTGGTGIINANNGSPNLSSVTGQYREWRTNITATPTGGGVAYVQYHEGTALSAFTGGLAFIDGTVKVFARVISGVVDFGSGFGTVRMTALAGAGINRIVRVDASGNFSASTMYNTIASSATPSINCDTTNKFEITAQAVDITSITVTGTPLPLQLLHLVITVTGTRNITLGSQFGNSTAVYPSTITGTNTLDGLFRWNSLTNKWRCIAVQ